MRRHWLQLVLIAIAVLVLALPAWCGIAFDNGGTATSASVTSLMVTYSPPTGAIVFCFLNTDGSSSAASCKDSGGTSLTPLASLHIGAGSPPFEYAYYYTAGAGVTGFTCGWTTSRTSTCIAIGYTCTGGTCLVSGSNIVTNSGASSSPTISLTIDDANDFMVACLADITTSVTITTGIGFRENVTTLAARSSAGDSSSRNPGDVVTMGASTTPTGWTAIAGEIRFTPIGQSNLLTLGVGE